MLMGRELCGRELGLIIACTCGQCYSNASTDSSSGLMPMGQTAKRARNAASNPQARLNWIGQRLQRRNMTEMTTERIKGAANLLEELCSDCPPVGYPTDKTRCSACPLNPSIKEQIAELKSAGWIHVRGFLWKAPEGGYFMGTHGAWKAMKRREGGN